MQGAGEQLLSGTALADQQDGGLGRRHPPQKAEGGEQATVAANDGWTAGPGDEARGIGVARAGDRRLHGGFRLFGEETADEGEEVVELDRLLEEVGCSELHGLHRRRHAAEAGHHHHRHRRLRPPRQACTTSSPDPPGSLRSVSTRSRRARVEGRHCRRGVRHRLDGISLAAEAALQHPPQRLAVLDHQQARTAHADPTAARARRTGRHQRPVVARRDRAQVEQQPTLAQVADHRRLALAQPGQQRGRRRAGPLPRRVSAPPERPRRRRRRPRPPPRRPPPRPAACSRARCAAGSGHRPSRGSGAPASCSRSTPSRAAKRGGSGAAPGRAGAGGQRATRLSPAGQQPRLGAAEQLVAAAADESAHRRRSAPRSSGGRRAAARAAAQEARPFVDEQRHGRLARQGGECRRRHRGDETDHAVVARVDLESSAVRRADGALGSRRDGYGWSCPPRPAARRLRRGSRGCGRSRRSRPARRATPPPRRVRRPASRARRRQAPGRRRCCWPPAPPRRR